MEIGITGYIGAGKDEVSKIIASEYGFSVLSFGNEVREEAKKRGIEGSREELQNLGDLLRREEDPSVWARRLMTKIMQGNNYVIDGIRNIEDVFELRKLKDFYLIGIDAPIGIRCERILKRKRKGDPTTFQEFLAADRKDRVGGNDSIGQNSEYCYKQADYFIYNLEGKDVLKTRVYEIMKVVLGKREAVTNILNPKT